MWREDIVWGEYIDRVSYFHWKLKKNWKNNYRRSEAFCGQENPDDTSISKKRHGPQQEENDPEQINNEGMLRGKSTPMFMNNFSQVIGKVVQIGCTLKQSDSLYLGAKYTLRHFKQNHKIYNASHEK